jgi:hypothetical protein
VLETVSVPAALPPAVGANVTLTLADCPEARTKGRLGLVTAKPDPVVVIWEIVTLPVPVLRSSAGKTAVWPTVTFPKLMIAGVEVS